MAGTMSGDILWSDAHRVRALAHMVRELNDQVYLSGIELEAARPLMEAAVAYVDLEMTDWETAIVRLMDAARDYATAKRAE